MNTLTTLAKLQNAMIEKHAGVDLPGSEPHIHITSGGTGEQVVHFMLFCPTDKATHLEQEIRADFMALYEQHFPEKKAEEQVGAILSLVVITSGYLINDGYCYDKILNSRFSKKKSMVRAIAYMSSVVYSEHSAQPKDTKNFIKDMLRQAMDAYG